MNEIISQLMGYLRGIWRYRWIIYALALPMFIAGWVFVQAMPDQYKASARVYVDTDSLLRPLLRGLAVEMNVGRQVDVMTKTIFSRPNLEKIARMTDLDLEAKTPEQMDDIVNSLKSNISLGSARGQNDLYTIAFNHENPQKAKQVVQSVLTIFVENTLGDKRRDTDSAQRFIDEQIKEYEQRLFEAEERLKEFKRKNVGMMPGSGGDYFSRMQQAQGELTNTLLVLKEAEQRRDELKRQVEDAQDEAEGGSLLIPQAPTDSASIAVDARIQNLQSRLDELLLQYTDNHPDIIGIKRTIEQLEERKAETQAALVESGAAGASIAAQNPMVQQLKLALGEAEANVAALNVRVTEFKSRVENVRKLVDTIPAVEAEFNRLNRDYDVNKRNYDQLISRRESAKLSESAEQSSENVKFRIVDPPFVGNEPAAPNRPVMVSIVFLVSLGVGLPFAFFLSQIKPSIDTTDKLRELTGLAVLGSISRVMSAEQVKKRRLEFISFLAVGVVFIGLYGVFVTAAIMGKNLLPWV